MAHIIIGTIHIRMWEVIISPDLCVPYNHCHGKCWQYKCKSNVMLNAIMYKRLANAGGHSLQHAQFMATFVKTFSASSLPCPCREERAEEETNSHC